MNYLLRILTLSCAIIVFGAIENICAQSSEDSVDDYFDDGSFSAKNLIKIDLEAMTRSEWTIAYERKISDILSLEIGGGILSPDHKLSLVLSEENYKDIIMDEGGYTASAIFKIYKNNEFDGINYGIGFRYRDFTDFRGYSFVGSASYQVRLLNRIAINAGVNFGFDYLDFLGIEDTSVFNRTDYDEFNVATLFVLQAGFYF